MHDFPRCHYLSLTIVTTSLAFLAHLPIAAAADPSSNETVVWNWPPVTVGPQGTDVVHTYNTIDTLNASWTSNLDFNPFLVVWCAASSGWTANQSGSVPPNGWHLIPLNLGLTTPYPISCHLGFDDQDHKALATGSANSGAFNITNVADSNPQIFGLSTSASASSAAAMTRTTSVAPAGATTIVVDSTRKSGGISASAIAGIVIAVVLGVGIVLGALVFLCLRKRRRHRRREEAMGTAAQDTEYHKPEAQVYMAGETATDQKLHSELPADSKPMVEKDGVQQPVEMPTEREPQGLAEMEGSKFFLGKLTGKSLKK